MTRSVSPDQNKYNHYYMVSIFQINQLENDDIALRGCGTAGRYRAEIYCRYGVKNQSINQSINSCSSLLRTLIPPGM